MLDRRLGKTDFVPRTRIVGVTRILEVGKARPGPPEQVGHLPGHRREREAPKDRPSIGDNAISEAGGALGVILHDGGTTVPYLRERFIRS